MTHRPATHVPEEELRRQWEYMHLLRAMNEAGGASPRALVMTFGCQQNEADSQCLMGMMEEMGYGFTEDPNDADLVLVNTCAVREHAEMRALGNVGALSHSKRAHPGQILCLCGCMVQQQAAAEKVKRSYPYVDVVFGTHALWRFPELLYRRRTGSKRVFDVADEPGRLAEGLPIRRDSTFQAWVPILSGCDNFCSYCIVPYVRGRERSREKAAVLNEIRELAAAGYKDITLLGQNVNSYGKDLAEPCDFADLLREAAAIPGDFRLRFMTSHPKDASEKLLQTMADCPKVARHLHLPVQAGSDRVLQAMNRGYTSAAYLALAKRARQLMPDLVMTSDIIVGFPGETAEEVEQTIELLRAVEFDALFTFIYSPRKGTPAAQLPDPMSREEKQRLFDRLLEAQNEISARRQAAWVGQRLRCLITGEGEDGRHSLQARTGGGRLVHLNGPAELVGQYADIRITKSSTWALFGEIEEGEG